MTVPCTLALVVSRGYITALTFAAGHYLALGKVDTYFEESSKMHLLGLPSALITLSIALGFDRIGTAGLVLGPLVLAVAAIGLDAATSADDDVDDAWDSGEEDVHSTAAPHRPARAMFASASDLTAKSDGPPDLPPRDGPATDKAAPPLPPRGPSHASPYAAFAEK